MRSFNKKLWVGLLVLALLSPLGILLPKVFNSGKPWGEWSTEQVAKDKGFVPKGMQKDANLYKAPIPDYNLGKNNNSVWKTSGSYIVSGLIGLGVIALISFTAVKFYRKNEG